MMVVLGLALCGGQPTASASEVITGQACIENGNIAKAREDARKDAMRTIVENRLGVRVTSSSEVINNMLVRDMVTAKADGYISVKKVLREWQSGDIYSIQMEVDVDNQKIQTAPAELKARLAAMSDDDTSRSGILVAIIGTDENNQLADTSIANQVFAARLQEKGFKTVNNDYVMQYLSDAQRSGAYNDKIRINNEVRRIARQNQEQENAIVRGELSTVKTEYVAGVGCKAIVLASFEMIGLENSVADTSVEYVSAVAPNKEEAVRKAKEMAVSQAAEKLGIKAMETVQSEFRGGVKTIKTTVQIDNITDRAGQRKLIADAFESLGCRVIRYSLTRDGSYRFFIETSGFNSMGELKAAIADSLALEDSAATEGDLGSAKIALQFKTGA